MAQRPRTVHRRWVSALVLVLAVAGLLPGLGAARASAGGATTTGRAFGIAAELRAAGGPERVVDPHPVAELAAGGSGPTEATTAGVAVEAPEEGDAASLFRSGPVHVRSERSPAGDAVTSSVRVQGDPRPDDGPGPLRFGAVGAACTADEHGHAAQVTVAGGWIESRLHVDTGRPLEPAAIPEQPPEGHTVEGRFTEGGDHVRITLNEQVDDGDGSAVVTAVRIELLGPSTTGEIVIGRVVCGVAAAPTKTVPAAAPGATRADAPSAPLADLPPAASIPQAGPPPAAHTAAEARAAQAEEVTAVTGRAFGFLADVSLFGGPSEQKGPEPAVALAADASNSPQDASADAGVAQYGPAEVVRTGPVDVHAEGALGADGSVTATATVQGDPDADARPGPLVFDEVTATCTAEAGGVTGTTTFTGGVVETRYDPDTQVAVETVPIPDSPPEGHTVEGTIDHVGDSFRITFNERIDNGDGSVTVNAARMELLGPIAVGEVIVGQSVCGVQTAVSSGPSPSPTASPATSPTPSPARPPAPTTVPPDDGQGEGEGVTSVAGSAFGFFADVGLFGGPSQRRGPEPTVELAADASNSPRTAAVDSALAQYGPAQIFRSGPVTVGTESALGADGYVASSVRVEGDPDESVRPGPLVYDAIDATCRADEEGVDSEVTFTGGVVETRYDADTQQPVTTEPVPINPPPGYTVEGTIDHVGDRYRIVFNERVDNGDGSITVNAAHMHLLGPVAVGELVVGQVQCAIGSAATGGVAAGGTGSGPRLAATGSNPLTMAALAAGLLLAGTVALRRGRAVVPGGRGRRTEGCP